MTEARSPGCVLMGPIVGLLLGIRNNALRATSFNSGNNPPVPVSSMMAGFSTRW
jgi:hypothetical protein